MTDPAVGWFGSDWFGGDWFGGDWLALWQIGQPCGGLGGLSPDSARIGQIVLGRCADWADLTLEGLEMLCPGLVLPNLWSGMLCLGLVLPNLVVVGCGLVGLSPAALRIGRIEP